MSELKAGKTAQESSSDLQSPGLSLCEEQYPEPKEAKKKLPQDSACPGSVSDAIAEEPSVTPL